MKKESIKVDESTSLGNDAKLPVSGCCWVVKFENGDSPFWLADWEGDPGRTLKIENAKRFVNFISADKARLEAEKNNPHRKLKGYPHSVDCNCH